MSLHISMTDFFCGAGGSSTGAIQVPGVSIRCAANHWQLAVDTHNENHPDADHYCADLSQIHPKYFPKTTFGWFSPECTNHSQAKGQKRIDAQPDLFGDTLPDEAAERSRATMWDVVRFSEFHRYEVVFVENVVEAAKWAPFQAWLAAMDSLGYDHRLVMLNSMHAQLGGPGAPQSRDRLYVVFWRRTNRAPDLERVVRPRAICPDCGPINAMQVFKKPGNTVGRYRQQYMYRCPNVKCRNQVLEPAVRPAAEIIDWSLLGERLGDKPIKKFVDKKTGEVSYGPLAPKTMARVHAGIDRYWLPLLVPVEGREGKEARPVSEPVRTMTTRDRHALLMRNNTPRGNPAQMVTPVSEPMRTLTTEGHQSLLSAERPTIDIDDVRFRMLEPHEQKRAMDFPADYVIKGNRREQARQAGNAVTPPSSRDLITVGVESLT